MFWQNNRKIDFFVSVFQFSTFSEITLNIQHMKDCEQIMENITQRTSD